MSSSTTTTPSTPHPRVGVAVFILHPTSTVSTSTTSSTSPPQAYKFLLGKRLSSHGSNTWALPGGHLEFSESFEDCAIRETLEETGLSLEPESVKFLTATNDVMAEEGKHYVTVFMTARVKDKSREEDKGGKGDEMPNARRMEPEKCAGWEWVGWGDLVGWAEGQRGRVGGEMKVREKDGDTTAEGADDGKGEKRVLFSPMIALLVQQPEAIPVLG